MQIANTRNNYLFHEKKEKEFCFFMYRTINLFSREHIIDVLLITCSVGEVLSYFFLARRALSSKAWLYNKYDYTISLNGASPSRGFAHSKHSKNAFLSCPKLWFLIVENKNDIKEIQKVKAFLICFDSLRKSSRRRLRASATSLLASLAPRA